jgi:hypothetical protein
MFERFGVRIGISFVSKAFASRVRLGTDDLTGLLLFTGKGECAIDYSLLAKRRVTLALIVR